VIPFAPYCSVLALHLHANLVDLEFCTVEEKGCPTGVPYFAMGFAT
jgi:hypothetical protein